FFTDGVIAQAVKNVVAQGKHYVTAAGNYATKSYESAFVPATGTPLPFDITGVAHNFGSSIYQSAIVKAQPGKPGVYTIGLQWEDAFSSLGAVGTTTDVDLYAINQAGELIGFNRINLSADPMEIMSFVVNPNPTTEVTTEIKLMIVCDGTPPPGLYFKFIVFRGDFTFLNPSTGSNAGTIVGQANVPEAHTIGAVRYTTPTIIEPFTSRGGVKYYGTSSQKPDYVAPDGVNTSVDMGSLVDPEGDGIKNFFGTSASAPHVAGGIALLLEAQKKFVTSSTLTPVQIKDLIRDNVQVIPGTVLERGAGLVRIDNAIGSFANPTPVIEGIQYPFAPSDSTKIKVLGKYFTGTITLKLNGVLLEITSSVGDSIINATIPIFQDKRGLVAYNPSMAVLGNDGGPSNTYYINGDNKFQVTIAADNKNRKFLGEMPAFTHKLYKKLNGVTTEVTSPDEFAMFGLTNLSLTTNAILSSNASVSPFNIAPVIPAADTAGNWELYDYVIQAGALFVEPLNVQVKPKNKNIVYGDYIGEIEYEYVILDNLAPANMELALAYLELSHKSSVSSNAFALLDDLDLLNAADQQALKIALGLPADATAAAIKLAFSSKLLTENLAFMVSLKTVLSSRAFDIVNNKMVAAVNANAAQVNVVDLNKASFINYLANPNNVNIALQQTISSAGTTSRGIVTPQAFSSAANVGGVNVYNSGYAQTLLSINQEGTVNKLVSKMPIYNNMIVHQLHGITNNGAATNDLSAVGIVHYIYSMGLVQMNTSGNYVAVPQGQPVVLSDGSIVANYVDPSIPGVMCMKQLLTATAEPLKIAIDQKIALATDASLSLMNINGVLRYVDVNNQVVNLNALIDLSALTSDLNAVALRSPLSTELTQAVDGTYLFNALPLKTSRIVMTYAPNTSGGLGLMVSSGGLGLMVSSGTGGLGLMVSSGGLGLMVSSGGLGLIVSSGGLGLIVSSGGLGLIVSSGGLGLIVSSNASTNGLANNTPIIFSQNEVENGGIVGPNLGINLVTGLSVGENYIIGGAFVNSNMNVHNLAGNLIITKATPTITVTAGGPYTYDGTPKPATGSATGTNNETLIPAVTLKYSGVSPTVYAETTTAPTNSGTYSVKAVFDGNISYNAGESAPAQFIINKATATIVVTPYSVVYNGVAHTAAGAATGVEATPANLASLLNLSGTMHTNAGTYTADAWIFEGNENYEPANGTINNAIGKADAIINISGYSVAFDANPHTATGTAAGVEAISPANLNSLLDLTATTHTNAGTYTGDAWSFAGNNNYNAANGTVNNSIGKANATITVNGYSGTYDATAHSATGSATGIGDVALTGLDLGASYTNAPGGTANWIFTDVTGNYNNASGSVNITISQASASITLSNLTHTYNGSPKSATATTTPLGLTVVTITGNGQTNAGNYPLSASLVNTNYSAPSVNGTLVINKANSTVSITGGIFNYDGSPKPATGFAYGAGGTGDILTPAISFEYTGTGATIYPTSATAPSLPGTYAVTGSFIGNDNYNSSTGSTTINISDNCPGLSPNVFNSFTDASAANGQNAPTTTMWVQVKIKLNGQLNQVGQFIEYNGGAVSFNGITMEGATTRNIPRGRIIAGAPSSPISSSFNMQTGMWNTIVPVNLNTSSDIFISGAIINSSIGFKKKKNTQSSTSVTGSFTSNVAITTKWLYSMAAYQVPSNPPTSGGTGFTYSSLSGPGAVIAVNSQPYGSGTPYPHISYVVAGGTGNGNGDYSGSTSSLDNFTACLVGSTANTIVSKMMEQPKQADEARMTVAPNPARDRFTVTFVPSKSGITSVRLLQVNGAEIAGIFEGFTEAGRSYNWYWNTNQFPAGIYLVRLVNNGEATTRKLVILK
nr:S8 family peptidase [Flavisolibacter sp.]